MTLQRYRVRLPAAESYTRFREALVVEGQHESWPERRSLWAILDDCGPDGEELDGMVTPHMALLGDANSDYAIGLRLDCFGLHSLHRQFPSFVERLSEVRQLQIPICLYGGPHRAPVSDVGVDAVARHQRDRTFACLQQGPEVLSC